MRSGDKLPPVLPIVLYNGEYRWKAPVDINDLIETIPGGLSKYMPKMQYLLLDEGIFGDEELRASIGNLTATLFRLENAEDPAVLLELVKNLLVWLNKPQQDSLRRAFVVWFQRVLLRDKLGKEAPAIEELEEVQTMLTERVKQWQKNWKAEGLAEGRAEGEARGEARGRAEGEAEGLKEALIWMLEKRFGEVDPRYLQQIADADNETVLSWSGKLLELESMEEIFSD